MTGVALIRALQQLPKRTRELPIIVYDLCNDHTMSLEKIVVIYNPVDKTPVAIELQ